MDLFFVLIILALILTVITLFLGLLVMSEGGDLEKRVSTPLMWARVGLQGLTILLLFIALLLR